MNNLKTPKSGTKKGENLLTGGINSQLGMMLARTENE